MPWVVASWHICLSETKGKRPVVPVKRALEISETRQRTRRVVRDRHLPRFRYEWRHNTQHWPTVGPISPFNGRFLVTRNFGKRSLCSIGPLGPYTKLSLILWFGVAAITVVSSAVTVRRRGRQKLSPQSRVGTSKNMLTVQWNTIAWVRLFEHPVPWPLCLRLFIFCTRILCALI